MAVTIIKFFKQNTTEKVQKNTLSGGNTNSSQKMNNFGENSKISRKTPFVSN